MKKLIVNLTVAVLLVACGQQTPEEQIKAYNKKLGSEGELTSTDLTIRWPERMSDKSSVPSIVFRIPREYLDDPPLSRDDNGKLRWLHIRFAKPDGRPWQTTPPPKRDDPPDVIEAERKNVLTRVNVHIDRDAFRGKIYRDAMRREGENKEYFWPDGKVAGLDRFSRLHCNKAGQSVDKSFIEEKEADDPAPPNCRVNRNEPILVSPADILDDNEGVAIRCTSTACSSYFSVGGRGVEILLKQEALPSWRDSVEQARQLIRRFIVPVLQSEPSATIGKH